MHIFVKMVLRENVLVHVPMSLSFGKMSGYHVRLPNLFFLLSNRKFFLPHYVRQLFITMAAEIIEKKLQIDGYKYYCSRAGNSKVYWDCMQTKTIECRARAITIQSGATLTVVNGPVKSKHSHLPNREKKLA